MNFEQLESEYKKGKTLATKKKKVFREDYLPDEIFFRDNQIKTILHNLQGEFNIFLSGDICTGKTLVIKSIFRFLRKQQEKEIDQDKREKFLCIYHYCKSSRLVDIYTEIGDAVGYKLQRNQSLKHHSKEIKKLIKRKGFEKVFLCLDEIDLLVSKFREDNELLYLFSNDPLYCLVLISNSTEFLQKLGSRTIDRLQIEVINFPNYLPSEVIEILKQRVKLGIQNGIISDMEIHYIEKAIRESNNTLREGIKMLGKIYDSKVIKGEIEPLLEETIKLFIIQVTNNSRIQHYKGLSYNLKVSIVIITDIFVSDKSKRFFTINDIGRFWDKKAKGSIELSKKSDSSIRRYLQRLETLKYIQKTKQRRHENTGYEYGYIPLFNVNEFNLYFERKQETKKFITDIEKHESRFTNVLDKLIPEHQE